MRATRHSLFAAHQRIINLRAVPQRFLPLPLLEAG
jgi:hypothetical protein